MYRARERGMTSPNYVYIYITMMPNEYTETPWEADGPVSSPQELEDRKEAFRALKVVGFKMISVCSVFNFVLMKVIFIAMWANAGFRTYC